MNYALCIKSALLLVLLLCLCKSFKDRLSFFAQRPEKGESGCKGILFQRTRKIFRKENHKFNIHLEIDLTQVKPIPKILTLHLIIYKGVG